MSAVSSLACVALWAWAAAALQAFTIPVRDNDACCFAADLSGRGTADLCVIDGLLMRVHPGGGEAGAWSVAFEPGTAAVDIADLDGDGAPELVAVRGGDILSRPLEEGATGMWTVLFQADTRFSGGAPRPFPLVLAVPWGGRTVLALPTDDWLELRTPAGELVERFAIGAGAAHKVSLGEPFLAGAVYPPLVGPPGSLELRVSRREAAVPDLPQELPAVALPAGAAPRQRRAALAAAAAGDTPVESWPWMPLRTGRDAGDDRVFYAYAPGGKRETLVALRRAAPATGGGTGAGMRLTPARRYPGILAEPEGEADFDGDGHTDLVLWNVRPPMPTVGAVGRALAGGEWPVRIALHAFDPASEKYGVKPWKAAEVLAGAQWLLEGARGPLRDLRALDFNGDHRTDLAFLCGEKTFCLWPSRGAGFSSAIETLPLPCPVADTVLTTDLDTSGNALAVLRGDGALVVVSNR